LMRSFMPVVVCVTLLGWMFLQEKKSN
jgi:hypothetical protein